MFSFKKDQMPTSDTAIAGRDTAVVISGKHIVLGASMLAPYPETSERLLVGLGCFWGAEKRFWQLEGVISTAVGYSAGFTKNPTYEEVCSGQTGHNEVVQIIYNPEVITAETLMTVFWESHNPTQGMRQGNDRGTQYRSGIYYFTETQKQIAELTQAQYQLALDQQMKGDVKITTEILPASAFYFAEEYHQQYLAKNPNGYCGLGGLGISL